LSVPPRFVSRTVWFYAGRCKVGRVSNERSKLRSLAVLGSLLLMSLAAYLFVGGDLLSMLTFKANRLVVGQTEEEVVAVLGVPDQRWTTPFKCVPCHPCDPTKQRGVVTFYRRGPGCGWDMGWYLFFDEHGRLLEFDGSTT
jgi:hypothetical protein